MAVILVFSIPPKMNINNALNKYLKLYWIHVDTSPGLYINKNL